jgi:hypothetical protein
VVEVGILLGRKPARVLPLLALLLLLLQAL